MCRRAAQQQHRNRPQALTALIYRAGWWCRRRVRLPSSCPSRGGGTPQSAAPQAQWPTQLASPAQRHSQKIPLVSPFAKGGTQTQAAAYRLINIDRRSGIQGRLTAIHQCDLLCINYSGALLAQLAVAWGAFSHHLAQAHFAQNPLLGGQCRLLNALAAAHHIMAETQ